MLAYNGNILFLSSPFPSFALSRPPFAITLTVLSKPDAKSQLVPSVLPVASRRTASRLDHDRSYPLLLDGASPVRFSYGLTTFLGLWLSS
jgi:hypothetical protein